MGRPSEAVLPLPSRSRDEEELHVHHADNAKPAVAATTTAAAPDCAPCLCAAAASAPSDCDHHPAESATAAAATPTTACSSPPRHHKREGGHGVGIRDLTLLDLPPEIHLMISKQLIYPDALSLKHTSRHFYGLVDTGVKLKVAWLMERRSLHLECPNNTRCDLGSDLRFCRGSVALLMQRRREHIECETRPGLGCLVFDTPSCVHRRTPRERVRRWLRAQLTVEIWWVLLAAVPLIFSLVWAMEFSLAAR